jgi:L-alanine-DL-glutamate epimerase-like enolase superfamily enzyme
MPRTDPDWRTASYADAAVVGFLLEVAADGLIGIGGTAAHPRSMPADALEAQLRGPVHSALNGADPYSGNRIRGALQAAQVHPRALIAADLALHDLIGKLAGFPCYVLWGGAARRQVAVVRMIGIKAPDDLIPHTRSLIDEGYTHFKVKIGTGVAEDVERIRALRKAFGKTIWIGVDGNSAYTPDQAIELCHALEPYGVSLIEQPTDYRDLDGLARVTASSPIPIMADQYVKDASSALKLCQARAAHVVSIKATKMGSIDECRRVAELCGAFNVRVHIGGSAVPCVVDAAQVHLAASLPGVDEECEVGEFLAVKGDPTIGLAVCNGHIEVPDSPGLGISLNPAGL